MSCSLRDMGTHLCALPTGEYCPKGLVCLGCTHAQPKQSAAPIFRGMLASHERALGTAHQRGEPAGQIAARQLEVSRMATHCDDGGIRRSLDGMGNSGQNGAPGRTRTCSPRLRRPVLILAPSGEIQIRLRRTPVRAAS